MRPPDYELEPTGLSRIPLKPLLCAASRFPFGSTVPAAQRLNSWLLGGEGFSIRALGEVGLAEVVGLG